MNDQTEYLHFGILYQIFFYPGAPCRKKHPIPHTLLHPWCGCQHFRLHLIGKFREVVIEFLCECFGFGIVIGTTIPCIAGI